jgi:hypothetical protein
MRVLHCSIPLIAHRQSLQFLANTLDTALLVVDVDPSLKRLQHRFRRLAV